MDSAPLLIPLIYTRTIKAGWRDTPLALQDFSLSSKQKIQFQLALNKTFYPTSPSLSHRQLKHLRKTKINKIMLSVSPHWFFTQSSKFQNWNADKHSILTAIKLGAPMSKSSTKISKFMPPLILNKNFIKRELKSSYP